MYVRVLAFVHVLILSFMPVGISLSAHHSTSSIQVAGNFIGKLPAESETDDGDDDDDDDDDISHSC